MLHYRILSLLLLAVLAFLVDLAGASTLAANTPQSSTGVCTDPSQYGSPGRQIFDISKALDDTTVSWGSQTGTPKLRTPASRRAKGDLANTSKLQLHTHLATHLDAPSHFLQNHLESGRGVEALDLGALNGAALVVQTPFGSNITGEVMQGLQLPRGIQRLILKTDNTERRLMHQTPFFSDYTAMDSSAAEWLVSHTDIKMIGIDYLSIAIFDDLTRTHEVLLDKLIIPVEGLVLDDVPEGIFDVHCLPLLLQGSDGSPCRCILM